MPELTIRLDTTEYEALQKLAYRERRNLKAQAAMVVRSELERLGMLPPDSGTTEPATLAVEGSERHAAQPA